jgi:flagellar hook-associated protein 2
MATTAVSSTSSASTAAQTTAAATAAANKAAAQSLINSLSAGSGVDVNALATNLVAAERTPQENAINTKITKNEARISGMSAISYVVSGLQTAMTALKDQSSFASLAASSTNSAAFTATPTASAVSGSHDVEVVHLAKSQRSISVGLPKVNTPLNGGNGLSFTLKLGDAASLSPVVTTQQGGALATEASTVTFKDMVAGQSITVAGLTYTATTATTANDVAAAFTGALDSANPPTPITGKFSGKLTGFSAGVSSGADLVFTSLTSNSDVTDISVSAGSPATSALSVRVGIPAGKDTPQGMVDAINATSSGVKAQLLNIGTGTNPYQIMLTGPTGVVGSYTIDMDYGSGSGTPGLSFTTNQLASDAEVNVDGINFKRSTNAMTDVIPGVTLNLTGTTGSTPATLNLNRDTTSIKDKINAVVTAYNDAISMLGVVSDPKSTVDTYGATLVGDSTVRLVKQQLRSMISSPSSTPSNGIGSLWQLGLSIDQTGVMAADASKLDTALSNNFDDVVKMFTGNQNNLAATSTTPGGIAGDAFKKLTSLLSNTGPMSSSSAAATSRNSKYQDDLTKLGTRMDALLARYQKQFASMNSIVGNVNSQKTSLKSTFDGMMASYTGKN